MLKLLQESEFPRFPLYSVPHVSDSKHRGSGWRSLEKYYEVTNNDHHSTVNSLHKEQKNLKSMTSLGPSSELDADDSERILRFLDDVDWP